ncbi:uncharacterized protein LOC126779787 [Nymphalis io]|uniref:uncharacterized protein LOC126779787 n=1 Tax=Inachis io TaxID=171585 RepID=UPI0021697271|nr:uncharacterized protein LOC126779787 [Nymphalis io]
MDKWEMVIKSYQGSSDPKIISRILKIAECVFAEDLAPFEIEWILATLLCDPINLLDKVSEQRLNKDWSRCTINSFKLLSYIVSNHSVAYIYYEDIVTVCLIPFDVQIRTQALSCLTCVVTRSPLGARDLNQHLNALEMGTTCRVPLALLIGTICNYHPEEVEEEMLNVWRLLLNLLDANKSSATLIKTALDGITGLLKFFEMDVPLTDVYELYDKMISFIDLPRCEKTVLTLLDRHTLLFRERMWVCPRVRGAVGARVRGAARECAREAVRSLYSIITPVVGHELLKNIINTEITPYLRSSYYYEKYTALYVLSDIYKSTGVGDLNEYVDIQTLEFDIRHGNINYETCEAISWCVESKLVHSDCLLQTAIAFYDKFIEIKRKEVIVRTILRADEEIRNAAITFLISETYRTASKQQQYIQLWNDLFNTNNNTNIDVIDNASDIADDVIENILGALEALGDEEMPPRLASQLSVLVLVQRLHMRSHASLVRALCAAARTCARAVCAAVVSAVYTGVAYENISIEQCLEDDEKLLCSVALIENSNDHLYRDSEMTIALEIIFTRNEVETALLCRALYVLDKFMQRPGRDEARTNEIIHRVENRLKRIDKRNKDDRILYRNIIMFLGKYGGRNNNTTNLDNILVGKLNKKISLELPYLDTTIKISLQGVLQAALEREDVDACKTLCAVICANLATKEDEVLQSALIRVLVCLSRRGTHVRVGTVLSGAVCANELTTYIKREKLQLSRKILLETLGELLKSEADGVLLQYVIESVIYYQDSIFYKQAILDMIEKLLELLRDNNLLCKKYLPDILIKVLKFQDANLIKIGTVVFKDKIELFDDTVLLNTTYIVFRFLNSMNENMADVLIKVAVMFVKNIFENKKDCLFIVDYYLTFEAVNLKVLVEFKRIYGFDNNTAKIIIGKFKNKLFSCKDFDGQDGLFNFIAEYNEALVDIDHVNTFKLLAKAIKKLTPESIVSQNIQLSRCLSLLKRTKKYDSVLINKSFESVIKTLPIKQITKFLERYLLEAKHELCVNAINILTNLYDWDNESILIKLSDYIKRWVLLVLKMNSTGYLERCLTTKMAFLYDVVAISVKFYNDEKLISIFLTGGPKSYVSFVRAFIPATFNVLIKRPYSFLLAGVKQCSSLFNDVVKYAVRRNRGGELVDVIDAVWPLYSRITTFDQKYSILLQLSPNLPSSSRPVQWVISIIKQGNFADNLKLVGLLNDENDVRGALAAQLPQSGGAARAALHALGARGRRGALELVASLAEGDNSKGWWEDAIVRCMSKLAKRADIYMLQYVYSRTFTGRGPGICNRLMVPLLRYVKPSLCEEFLSSVLNELLTSLMMTPRAISNHYTYEKCVMDYVRALNIIVVAFERVPKANIESPRSMLYSKMSDTVRDTPFYLISTVCKLCFTLRAKISCPEGADQAMEKTCRLFHCANYNCMATAIILRDPKPQVYATVFDETYWYKLIGDEEFDLPIREPWRLRVTHQADPTSLSELHTRTHSDMHTRMFTRTLSENPLAYDLLQEPEEVEPREPLVSDNPLDRHPCSAALSSLLAAVGSRGVDVWGGLERVLSEGPPPLVSLLAHAVVTSRQQLRARAKPLQRALLAALARTARRRVLNALHVDILDTLILWRENTTENTDLTIECIINTAISNRNRANVFWMLVDKLDKLLEIWKEARPNWTSFEKYIIDQNSDIIKVCLQILKRFTRREVQIPQLVPALLAAIESKKYMIEVYEVLGLAMAIDDKRGDYIKGYLKVLENLRKSDVAEYLKCLYYAQKGYPECCDERNFRLITDLTPKISGREKLKCLEILSTYLLTARQTDHVVSMLETVGLDDNLNTVEGLKLVRNGLHLMNGHHVRYYVLQMADACQHLPVQLRWVAFEILVKALELLLSPESSEPPSKRSSPESNSLILGEKDDYTASLLEGLARGMVDGSEEIRNSVRTGVGKLLNDDLGIRFCESVYLAVLLVHTECEINPAAILDMFFQILRNQKLKNTKLRNEPIKLRETTSSNLSTNMMTSNIVEGDENTSEVVNVEITLDELLDSLLKFSQRNINAATSIIIQLVKANQMKSPGFDFPATLGACVAPSLTTAAARWSAEVVRKGRLWNCDSLKPAINTLLKMTKGAEDESIYKLLSEDYKLRSLGPEQFVLGSPWLYGVNVPDTRNFSMKDLVATFGKLSNWENLTIQQKSSITSSLPPIWTNSDTLIMSLEDMDETDYPIWMKCMVSSCLGDFDNHFTYFKDVDKWPRKLFDISAVAETSVWKTIHDVCSMKDIHFSDNIRPSDCISEWAVRIMVRSMFMKSSERVPGHIMLSRSRALQWCVRASECGLHEQVVECCRNITDIYENDTLKWLRQRVLALRALALGENNSEGLSSTLNLAVSYTPMYLTRSNFGDVMGMNEAILKIRNDLQILSKIHLDGILVRIQHRLQERYPENTCDKKVFESICVFAMLFYDRLWDFQTEPLNQNQLLLNMSEVLGIIIDLDMTAKVRSADIIINRLDGYLGQELDDGVAKLLLSRISEIFRNLDQISLGQLKSQIGLFKKFEDYEIVKRLKEDESLMKYKRCLNLVGDAEHLLIQYWCKCFNAIDDKIEWTKIFEEMKNTIFENPFAGPDYRVLNKHKANLYGIAEFDSTDKETKQRVLSTVRSDLKVTEKNFVSLSHVCPELTAKDLIASESLNKLLCLKPGVTVFRFEEKIPIFVDSIRRPAVLRALLSDGSVRRFIVKRGERVRSHCAAVRLLDAVRGGSCAHAGYRVTALSDDSALIEYLEGHARFRTLIASQYPIDSAVGPARGSASELVLDPTSALRHFEDMCKMVPPYALRSAVEENSACVEDFISRKSNFLEAIIEMTIFSYLCGVGDRHLSNLLCNARGSACHVDCGSALQYGAGELPPARLTRNVLALCNPRALESRLQSRIQSLQAADLILPSISVTFKWLGPTFMDKLKYINSLIKGTSLSYTVTKEVISKSTKPYKDKYIQLLEEVFKDFEEKEFYSIEEQVSCLLLQCTDPRILSITRANWEPWI